MAKGVFLAALAAITAPVASARGTMYMAGNANVTGINANPNVTAVVPVAGWDLRKTFPGRWDNDADPVRGGWTMHLNITANVTANRDFLHNNSTRGTRISLELKPPPGLIDPQSGNWTVDRDVLDSWRLWIVQWNKGSISGARNNDDGSCTDILTDDCISSIKANLAAPLAVVQGNDTKPVYAGLTSKCPFSGSSIGDVPLDNNFLLNATRYNDEPIKDETSYDNAYDFFGSRPIAFAVIFGHGNDTEYVTGQPLEHDHVTVGCIRADTKIGDSTMPNGSVGRVEERLSIGSLLSAAAIAGLVLLW